MRAANRGTKPQQVHRLKQNQSKTNASRKPGKSFRRVLNSARDAGFEKYFDRVTDQQLADYYGIPVEDITDTNDDIERANYGKVVGHYIPKDEYAEVLVDYDWDTLDILEDGTVGFSLGEGGGKAVRFYGVDIEAVEDAIKDAGLNSSARRTGNLNSAKRIDAAWYYSLDDVENVVSAVLDELNKDNGAAITLEATDTGIALNVTSSEGDDTVVDVDLGIEGEK